MNRSALIKECFGIEEIDEVCDISENDDGVFAATQGECNTLLNNLGDACQTSCNLTDDLETVECCSEVVNNDEHQIDGGTAEIIEATIESIYRRHGMKRYYVRSVYSREDFDLFQTVDDAFGTVVDKGQQAADYVSDKYKAAKKTISDKLSKLKDTIMRGLAATWDKTKDIFNNYLGKKSKVADMLSGSILKIKQLLSDAGEYFSSKGKLVINFITGKDNKGKQGKSISDKDFISKISNLLDTVVSSVNKWADKVVTGIKSGVIFDIKIGQMVDSALDGIGSVYSTSKEGLSKVVDVVGVLVKKAMKSISDCGNKTLGAIKDIQKSVSKTLNNSQAVDDIKSAISNAGKMIKEGTYKVCQKIGSIIDTCGNFIRGAISSIKKSFNEWMKESKDKRK